jgi:uncharacterized RDD family membrane protein YckC
VNGAAPSSPVGYVGLVTRVVAVGIDVVVINVVVVVFGGVVNLIASLFGYSGGVSAQLAVIGGVLWWLWIVGYFVTLWTLTGQTIGNRIMGIRVEDASGGPITGRQALRRFAGSVLAALPLGAGFLLVLVDDRRQGLQDKLAHTVVRWHSREEEYESLPPAVVAAAAVAAVPAQVPAGSTPPPSRRPTAQGSD